MNRYKSSQRWDRLGAGWYQSPDKQWRAMRQGPDDRLWLLCKLSKDGTEYQPLSAYLTLADCQEIAAGRDACAKAAWWGYVEGAKANPHFFRSRHGGRGDV